MRGGNGDAAVASYSMVAMSSVFWTTGRGDETLALGVAVPHEEQKRTLADSSVPQEEQ